MRHHNLKKATIYTLSAALSFSIMALFVKRASPYTNNNMVIFFRFSISFLYILILVIIKNLKKHKKLSLRTKNFGLHFIRSIASLFGMLFFYFSLKFISLVDGTLLVMTATLFVPILGFIFFRHKTDIKHWLAITVGFIGVALVLKPGHTLFNPKALYALAAGFSGAVAILLIREQVKKDDPYVCMFYYFLIAFVISGAISVFHWDTPDIKTFLYLVCVGIFGTLYQEFLIRGSHFGPAKVISSLMYLSIIFSAFWGWMFFKEFPDYITIIGIILVFLGGILTVQFAKKKYL